MDLVQRLWMKQPPNLAQREWVALAGLALSGLACAFGLTLNFVVDAWSEMSPGERVTGLGVFWSAAAALLAVITIGAQVLLSAFERHKQREAVRVTLAQVVADRMRHIFDGIIHYENELTTFGKSEEQSVGNIVAVPTSPTSEECDRIWSTLPNAIAILPALERSTVLASDLAYRTFTLTKIRYASKREAIEKLEVAISHGHAALKYAWIACGAIGHLHEAQRRVDYLNERIDSEPEEIQLRLGRYPSFFADWTRNPSTPLPEGPSKLVSGN